MVYDQKDLRRLSARHEAVETRGPALPIWLFMIRMLQLAIAIAVLGLIVNAYIKLAPLSSFSYTFFVFAWTFTYLFYLLITTFFLPILHHIYAHLLLELITIVFWIATLAVLARDAADYSRTSNRVYEYYDPKTGLSDKIETNWGWDKVPVTCVKAAAVLSAVELVLFIITFFMALLWFLKQRNGVGQVAQSRGDGEVVATSDAVPLHSVRHVPATDEVSVMGTRPVSPETVTSTTAGTKPEANVKHVSAADTLPANPEPTHETIREEA